MRWARKHGFAVFPPAIPIVGNPGAVVHEKESAPGLELVDCDASKLTAPEPVSNVFVGQAAPPGPVIAIVIPAGGGVTTPWINCDPK